MEKVEVSTIGTGEDEFDGLPATIPIDAMLDDLNDHDLNHEVENVWANLYPHCGTFPRIPLTTDSFKMGRGRSNDYVIRESDMGGMKWLSSISKIQCQVVKLPTGVFLKDWSSNGTFVNGVKIGKCQMMPLEHDSVVSFAEPSKKIFVFMKNDEMDKFPPALTKQYAVSKVLGRGAVGEVRLGFRVSDMSRVAIKIIDKGITSTSSTSLMNEVKILKSVNHPCVIKLEDVIETEDKLFLVLELAEGGDCFDKIKEKSRFTEEEAKIIFYQIVSAIEHLHQNNICHRDLKPENILICKPGDDKNCPLVKVTDMGLSKLVDLDTVLKTICGTPMYIAPEVLAVEVLGNYTVKVDCWSLGVILYILLSGAPPFSADYCSIPMRDQILSGKFVFYTKFWHGVSEQAKDLVSSLLKVNPEERLSAQDILKHPWMKDDDVIAKAKAIMENKAPLQEEENTVKITKIETGKKRGVSETESENNTKRPNKGVLVEIDQNNQ